MWHSETCGMKEFCSVILHAVAGIRGRSSWMREWRSCWRLHGALRQRGHSRTSRSPPAPMAAPAQQRPLPCLRAMWHPISAAQVLVRLALSRKPLPLALH